MIIYFKKHPEFQQKYQSHKKFCAMLVHDLVQPLLYKISSGEIVYGKRKPNDIAANRLTGKHFSVSKFSERKACHNCGHSKSKNGYKGKKLICTARTVINSFVRRALSLTTPLATQKSRNIIVTYYLGHIITHFIYILHFVMI